MARAVILGMNNPLSPRPEHALFPYPPGCTGYRIWRLLQTLRPDVMRSQYLSGFDRMNMIDGREWSDAEARRRVPEVLSRCRGRVVLVLGEGPRRALGLRKELILPQEHEGATWRQLPHPSGRCHWYNDPECAALAASLLRDLYEMGEGERQ